MNMTDNSQLSAQQEGMQIMSPGRESTSLIQMNHWPSTRIATGSGDPDDHTLGCRHEADLQNLTNSGVVPTSVDILIKEITSGYVREQQLGSNVKDAIDLTNERSIEEGHSSNTGCLLQCVVAGTSTVERPNIALNEMCIESLLSRVAELKQKNQQLADTNIDSDIELAKIKLELAQDKKKMNLDGKKITDLTSEVKNLKAALQAEKDKNRELEQWIRGQQEYGATVKAENVGRDITLTKVLTDDLLQHQYVEISPQRMDEASDVVIMQHAELLQTHFDQRLVVLHDGAAGSSANDGMISDVESKSDVSDGAMPQQVVCISDVNTVEPDDEEETWNSAEKQAEARRLLIELASDDPDKATFKNIGRNNVDSQATELYEKDILLGEDITDNTEDGRCKVCTVRDPKWRQGVCVACHSFFARIQEGQKVTCNGNKVGSCDITREASMGRCRTVCTACRLKKCEAVMGVYRNGQRDKGSTVTMVQCKQKPSRSGDATGDSEDLMPASAMRAMQASTKRKKPKNRTGWPSEKRKRMNGQEGYKKLKCQYCPLLFNKEASLAKHTRDSHGLDSTIIKCTACSRQLGLDHSTDIFRHPVLYVLICRKCYTAYNNARIKKDANGSDEQCRWCLDGGDVICCDFCHNVICKQCISINLSQKDLCAIPLEADATTKWKCYICDPSPIVSLVDRCSVIMKVLAKQECKQPTIDRSKKTTTAPNFEESTSSTARVNSTNKKLPALNFRGQHMIPHQQVATFVLPLSSINEHDVINSTEDDKSKTIISSTSTSRQTVTKYPIGPVVDQSVSNVVRTASTPTVSPTTLSKGPKKIFTRAAAEELQELNTEHFLKSQPSKHPTVSSWPALLVKLGLQEVDMPGDGDCFFHALAHQVKRLFGQDFNSLTLRTVLTTFIETNPYTDDGSHIDEFLKPIGKTVASYVADMKVGGVYADSFILMAAATAWDRPLVLYYDDGDATVFYRQNGTSQSEMLTLGYINRNHYVSLVPACMTATSSVSQPPAPIPIIASTVLRPQTPLDRTIEITVSHKDESTSSTNRVDSTYQKRPAPIFQGPQMKSTQLITTSGFPLSSIYSPDVLNITEDESSQTMIALPGTSIQHSVPITNRIYQASPVKVMIPNLTLKRRKIIDIGSSDDED